MNQWKKQVCLLLAVCSLSVVGTAGASEVTAPDALPKAQLEEIQPMASHIHVMMNVLNDGVKTQYSAHTNDRKMYQYTPSSLLDSGGVVKIEYYIFDNVYPAH